MPEYHGSKPDIVNKEQQVSVQDTTVEEIRFFVRRLKRRWQTCAQIVSQLLERL
jgi:hypothetical protein